MTKNGFTLIETLVAVTILTLAVAAPISAVNSALVASYTARDRLTATYLGEEGIEYVRALRDNAYLQNYITDSVGNTWGDFLSSQINGCRADQNPPQKCTLDPVSASLITCPGGSCTPLYISSSGRYTQSPAAGNTQTSFTREIQVEAISPTEERVTSTVSWLSRGVTYDVQSIDHLTAWQQ